VNNIASPIIQAELKRLRDMQKMIKETWNKTFGPRNELDADVYNEAVEQCYQCHEEIEPLNTKDPVIEQWTSPIVPGEPTRWQLLKASALYDAYYARPTFAFLVAGRELCYLKSHSGDADFKNSGTRTLVNALWSILRPGKVRPTSVEVSVDEMDVSEDSADDDAGLATSDYFSAAEG